MAKTLGPKYKLLRKKKVKLPGRLKGFRVYQIEAIRDIPLHGIKAGDLGGYVSLPNTLSQDGECWIKENSMVISSSGNEPAIQDNALVGTNYLLECSQIRGNAVIAGGGGDMLWSNISDDTEVYGPVDFDFVELHGSTTVKLMESFEFGIEGSPYVNTIIRMNGCLLTNAKIRGNGSISYASSKLGFTAEGCFKMEFVTNNYDRYLALKELTQSFSASGEVTAQGLGIKDVPVKIKGKSVLHNVSISGRSFMMDGGNITESKISGIFETSGNVTIEKAIFEGENILKDRVIVKQGSHFKGKNILSGDTLVPDNSHLYNVNLNGGFAVTQSSSVDADKHLPSTPDNTNAYRLAIRSIEEDYEEYTTDIVKLIKYPAMVDSSVPETQEFMVALRTAKRAMKYGDVTVLKNTSSELERAFVRAENNAYKLAATFLEEKDRTSLKRAENALAIALDENANEHERRAGYKSGMKSLEGVLPVSEQAVSVLKERIGLKEIEA